MQQYAGIYLLQVYSTWFGHPSRIIRSTNNSDCSLWYRSYYVTVQRRSSNVA